jgi:hypothetical protein
MDNGVTLAPVMHPGAYAVASFLNESDRITAWYVGERTGFKSILMNNFFPWNRLPSRVSRVVTGMIRRGRWDAPAHPGINDAPVLEEP